MISSDDTVKRRRFGVWLTNMFEKDVSQRDFYLNNKIIGPPQKTEKCSETELIKMGLVGVYEERI